MYSGTKPQTAMEIALRAPRVCSNAPQFIGPHLPTPQTYQKLSVIDSLWGP